MDRATHRAPASVFRWSARVEGKRSFARLGIGVHVTAPTIHAAFSRQYTRLGVDVTVRIGALQDSSLIARRLTASQLRIAGAPDYFARHGRPQAPEDLVRHRCLPFTIRDTRVARDWQLRRDGVDSPFTPNAAMSFNDGSAIVAAACAGYGLVQMNDYTTDGAIAAGALEPVLEAFNPSPTPIWLVYPAGRHLSPKVRAFVDFMAARLR
jgi:LysR family transcriptional regulator for bpeEF and oprC